MVGTAQKSMENKRSYKARNFSVPDYVGEASHTFLAQSIFLFLLATGRILKDLNVRDDG